MSIQGIIPLLIALVGTGFAGFSLVSKTAFESIFMTTEQKMKRQLFTLLGAVLYFTFLFPFLYVAWGTGVKHLEFAAINWERATAITLYSLVISALIMGIVVKRVGNFVIKEKIMYKVDFPDLGEMYLIKMLDRETCIFSTDKHLNLEDPSEAPFLVKMEDLMKLPILKESVPVPNRNFYQKLFDL
ncbi:hypothetical protein [Planococcus ruber]|uniref:hypothetical protein n=1 Tax=Planococcus ruber TaxID=2027871 RepID=UPI001FEEC666|nr:hypothetical protein [Planococcus ruber]MCJ1908435.1 hypothetical protein [Planococcus ruber]